jgi:hypothetical protein
VPRIWIRKRVLYETDERSESSQARHGMPMDARAQRKGTREVRVLFRYVPVRRRRARCFSSCPCIWRRSRRATGSRPPRGARAVAEQPRSGRPDQAPACALIGEHLPLTTGEYNSPSREGQGRRSRVEYYFLRLRQSATRTLGQRACVSRLPSFGSKLACVRARPSFHGPDAALVRAPRLTACTCIYLGAGVCSLFRPSELQALQHSTRSISFQPGFRSGRQEPHFGH